MSVDTITGFMIFPQMDTFESVMPLYLYFVNFYFVKKNTIKKVIPRSICKDTYKQLGSVLSDCLSQFICIIKLMTCLIGKKKSVQKF